MSDLLFGLQITVVGMGLVFALLAVMWALLTLLLRLERADEPTATPAPAPRPQPVVEIVGDELDPDTVAAITIAVMTHASVRRKQAAPSMRSYRPGSLLYASRWVTAGRSQQHDQRTQRR